MRARESKPFVRVTNERGEPLKLPSGRTYPPGGRIAIETDRYRAAIATEGYVSGVAAGTFVDKATGARDLGFGLSIVDFLLEPAPKAVPPPKGQYEFGNLVHGNLPKRYVEGPQICTQAKRLPATIALGKEFAAIQLKYQWNVAYPPHEKAGSVWEQTLIFPQGERFFLSADRVTTVSESPELYFRVDMPGHIKKDGPVGFEHVYLSYNDPAIIPSTEFMMDFPPDEKFLYRRGVGKRPERFIRAYQVDLGPGRDQGPWLAGMTLNVDDVYQAWCHERGYVCMIEELGGRPTKPGDTFGACYLIGWFDDVTAMNQAYDRYRGISGLALDGPADAPTAFRGLKANELTPVTMLIPNDA
jgi:hypothetical protein